MKTIIWAMVSINILLLIFLVYINFVENRAISMNLFIRRDDVKGMKEQYDKIEFETDKICKMRSLILTNENYFNSNKSNIDSVYVKIQKQVQEEFAYKGSLIEDKLHNRIKSINKIFINNELVHIFSVKCEFRLLHQYYWRYVYVENELGFHFFITKLKGKNKLCNEIYPARIKLDGKWSGPDGITTIPKILKVATLSGGYKVRDCDISVSK